MAMVIRRIFDRGGAQMAAQMLPHEPRSGITERLDLTYTPSPNARAADTMLDVFTQDTGTGALPTVIWIHGGGWVAGDKAQIASYLKILAAQGYTTVGLNYTRGPDGIYPTAIQQLTTALTFLLDHADQFRIDPSRLVIAGDSAGAQLASQVATMITNPDYANLVGIRPTVSPDQLRGVILNCGVYDLDEMARATGLGLWGFRKCLWAYTGSRDWAVTPAGTQMSTIRFVSAQFPPTYISGGNGDPLTPGQSTPMAERLRRLGVPLTTRFFAPDHQPEQPHEYQFALGTAEADAALAETLTFLKGLFGRS